MFLTGKDITQNLDKYNSNSKQVQLELSVGRIQTHLAVVNPCKVHPPTKKLQIQFNVWTYAIKKFKQIQIRYHNCKAILVL